MTGIPVEAVGVTLDPPVTVLPPVTQIEGALTVVPPLTVNAVELAESTMMPQPLCTLAPLLAVKAPAEALSSDTTQTVPLA